MQQPIFVWFYRAASRPKGVPFHLDTMLAEQVKLSGSLPGFDYPWVRYNPYQMDFPPTDPALRLPEHLFFIVKKEKEVVFDFLHFKNEYKIVSQRFLDYLEWHGPQNTYEKAQLTVVNTAGKSIAKQPYYALRFGLFDDNKLSFKNEAAATGLANRFLYRDITLAAPTGQDLFFARNFCYQETVLVTADAKRDLERMFYSPEIYPATKFIEVYQADNAW